VVERPAGPVICDVTRWKNGANLHGDGRHFCTVTVRLMNRTTGSQRRRASDLDLLE
jgi:hypothetical protein